METDSAQCTQNVPIKIVKAPSSPRHSAAVRKDGKGSTIQPIGSLPWLSTLESGDLGKVSLPLPYLLCDIYFKIRFFKMIFKFIYLGRRR